MALEEVAGVVLRVLVMMGTPPHSPLHYSAAQIWPSEGPGVAAAADRLTGWGGARRSEREGVARGARDTAAGCSEPARERASVRNQEAGGVGSGGTVEGL